MDTPEQAKKENLHAEHRRRLRRRYMQTKGEGFEPHELLELLLFHAIPRRDTNALAHRLLTSFQSLEGVFQASVPALMAVEGVGETTAVMLHAMGRAYRLQAAQTPAPARPLSSTSLVCAFGKTLFAHEQNEVLYLLNLDARCRLIKTVRLAEGSASAVQVNTRALTAEALHAGAASVIILHNHPRGYAQPSPEDIRFTRVLSTIFSGLGIIVYDHVIIGAEASYSFKQHGDMDRIEKEVGIRYSAPMRESMLAQGSVPYEAD